MSLHPNVKLIAKLITSEIRTIEDKKTKWASFKRENAETFRSLFQLEHTDMKNPGELLGFDIDEDRSLILLNYTGQAHNVLHEIENGWSQPLRDMRGMIYDFSGEEPQLVSRGFEKFFNFNELPENSYQELKRKHGEKKYIAREKADGHMIEYFVHKGELCSSTRGKFGTVSADIASTMFTVDDFKKVEQTLGKSVMSIIVELIHPYTEIFVNYENAETLYLLNIYDATGEPVSLKELELVCEELPELFICPVSKEMSLDEIVNEVSDRSISNNEGWVVDFNGQLLKFKYIDYIGMMVNSKLSYKYLMNCMIKERLDRMLLMLPEEIREHAYNMVDMINETCEGAENYKALYELYNENEGGENYYRTVCRNFWKEMKQTA